MKAPILRRIAPLLLLFALAACGAKGPLFLPPGPTGTVAPLPPTPPPPGQVLPQPTGEPLASDTNKPKTQP
jgi:predicted small lipoprotein YifL